MSNPLAILRKDNKIFSHIRRKWLDETPEENVRQTYLCTLVNEYGYALDQIAEEVTLPGKRGNRHARADFVIWRTVQDKREGKTALIVVECKADNVTINPDTYEQGANYANNERARFLVAHNRRSTKFFKVDLTLRAPNYAEVKDIPRADASDAEIKELLDQLKPFEGKEFADLLHSCHNIIRNNEHLDPAAAFDEIAKILFVKVMVERSLKEKRERQNLFTVKFLKTQIAKSPIDALFDETKNAYRADKIFANDERINLRPATVENIVRKLEGYNLSDTGEDIKGIAFERFLGGTFRGEIGQFFTPRPIVEFVVRMLDPREGECICDPASGSGCFLIRCFEIIREAIAADVDKQYKDFCATLDAKRQKTLQEITARYQSAIDVEHARIKTAIKAAKDTASREEIASLRKHLAAFEKQMAETIAAETRALLKQRLDYPIFLYEAEHVGITATGDPDLNELYPNPNQPPGLEKTCLELYREFQKKTYAFSISNTTPSNNASTTKWTKVVRWSPYSFREVSWNWPEDTIKPLSAALNRRQEAVNREEHSLNTLTFGSLHFDGELTKRNMAGKTEVKGKLFFAYPNDVVYSKIDVRNGAIGIISETGEKMVFSSEYPIYKVDTSVALPQYIRLLFRTAHFQNHINSLISGASGRKLIEPSILEQIEVPLPTIQKQKEIIVPYIKASETVAAATECLVKTIKEVDEIILGRRTLPIILQ